MIQELEAAIAARLAPLQAEGIRVLGAPTDSEAVGRAFGEGECRVAYSSRDYSPPEGLRTARNKFVAASVIRFEVVLELKDTRLKSHPKAAKFIEKIVDLLFGWNPDGRCEGPLYPIRDGFVGRTQADALWIYSAVFALNRPYIQEV